MQLSRNFSLEELCASNMAKTHNIRNYPTEDKIIVELTALCQQVLQPLREFYRKPISINSGYRSLTLNALVGGVDNSQHTKGQAADINVSNDREVAEGMVAYMQRANIPFDQAIIEHDKKGNLWLHVSHCANGQNRGNVILNMEKKK